MSLVPGATRDFLMKLPAVDASTSEELLSQYHLGREDGGKVCPEAIMNMNNITHITAEENHLVFHTTATTSFDVLMTYNELRRQLDEHGFFRKANH